MATGQIDVLRRSYYGRPERDSDPYRKATRGLKLNRGGNHGLVRKSGYRSSSSSRDFYPQANGFGCRTEERELGELWSFEEGEIPPNHEESCMPPEKKRKLSPAAGDVDEGGDGLSRGSIDKTMPLILSPVPPRERHEDYDKEEEQGAEVRNISMSRWASDCDSPVDAALSDDRDTSEKMASVVTRCSAESGELLEEGSDGCRSSVSEGNSYSMDSDGGYVLMDVDEMHDEAVGAEQKVSNDSPKLEVLPAAIQRGVDMLHGCRDVREYEKLNEINEGTYGKVYRARDRKTGEIVALKKVKMDVGGNDGFPLTALREINILLSLDHPAIVTVKEVVMGDLDSIFMVMEFMEHDLKGLMQVMKQPFSTSEVKCLMLQLLEGVQVLHDNWVLHRDLKSSNILFNNQGKLKICDFGMSRQYGSPLKPYSELVVTLWYRAPELLLGRKKYSTAVDMWSVGCIMAELLTKEPLFKGKNEIDQLSQIFKTLGTPNESTWPGLSELPGAKASFVKQPYNLLRKKFPVTPFTTSPVLSDLGFDLLNKLLTYDPEKRITAAAALNHPWFHEVPLPKSKEFMPTFPPQHLKTRKMVAQ